MHIAKAIKKEEAMSVVVELPSKKHKKTPTLVEAF